MINPVSNLKNRTTLLFILVILNACTIAVMQSFTSSLKPFSIIGFEFAGSPDQAHLMVDTWRENGVLHLVYFITGFDYLFMATYGSLLWLACLCIANNLPDKVSKVFIVLAWLQPVAALLDAIENIALYQIISGSWEPLWPALSAVCAAPKFAIVLTAVLACLAASVYKIVRNYSKIG